ncbi:MAG TPA: copper amine oxidase N-terminal domain-containing protein [Symbiobacteriaceae bacterium]|nr:copper amine oxidase N-terminal domain-containing protein [Symbiobacteriaceae bacterium]
MKHVRKLIALAAAAVALLAVAGGARADVTPSLPATAPTMTLSGTLEYVRNLETPHYELNGWVLTAPDQAAMYLLAGHTVTVTGRPVNSYSILMRKQLAVSAMTAVLEGELQAAGGEYQLSGWMIRGLETEVQSMAGSRVRMVGSVVWRTKGPPTMQVLGMMPLQNPVARQVTGTLKESGAEGYSVDKWVLEFAHTGWLKRLSGQEVTVTGHEVSGAERPTLRVTDLQVTMTGTVMLVSDVETPHWELSGFVLDGAAGAMQPYANRPCTVTGSLSQEMSIYMRPVLKVSKLSEAGLPAKVVVRGVIPALPAPAVYRNGYLMLPLRAVVEAAGGQVAWDPAQWAVRVTVGDQKTLIRIGSREAGTVALSVAPYLHEGHTMAPLDLFERVGLRASWVGETLHLSQNQ